MIDRREFVKRASVLTGSQWVLPHWLIASPPSADAPSRFKLGAISDGFSQDFEEALLSLKSFGLKWVEIREIYGVYNTEASTAQIKRVKQLLDRYQFRVSVIDSALYKCTLPGTRPSPDEKDVYNYSAQMDLLKRAIDRAHAWGADKIRGFTFWRVSQPDSLSERIAEELQNAAEVAARGEVRLVIENEESCNVATGRELARVLKLAPAPNLGANWDVGNGYSQGEQSFPAGYDALSKQRIWHLHLKGVACAASFANCSETAADQGQIDLSGQLLRLVNDNYQETMSLECEFKLAGQTHRETTSRSMEGLLRVMNSVFKHAR